MIVLGLHLGHDGAACIVKDGRLVAAIATERLTRNKKCFGITPAVIDYILNAADVTIQQVDAIGLSDWSPDYVFGAIEVFKTPGDQPMECTWNTIYENDCIRGNARIRGCTIPTYNIGHQLCHAASAFYTSPFDEAYCFSLDASGAKIKNNSLVAHGKGNKLEALPDPGLMVGCAYGDVCERLGLGSQMFKAGAMMGLASYGNLTENAKVGISRHIDKAFCTFDSQHHKWMDELWADLSGGPNRFPAEWKDNQRAMDIAATMQWLFEQCILKAVDAIPNGDCENLCLSGGSMLNCNANSAILRQGKFKRLHLFPACSDDGGAVGVAFYVAHNIMDEPRRLYADREIAYLGADRPMKVQPDCPFLAQEIANGKIVAWCCGRSEYGPRALGNRSIFADPRWASNRERVNREIKNREWFRPIAPIALAYESKDWFDFPIDSPFMLFTAQSIYPDKISAVTHIDGSARMQTVTRTFNRHVYDIISEFEKITGVPVLINTSLNVDGEPMVETTEDAMRFWEKVPVDYLVLDGELWKR